MDNEEVTITMSEKEWEQVYCALLTYEAFAKVAKTRTPEKRRAALKVEWTKTQMLVRILYKSRIAKAATEKIGRAIGDDWPQGDQE